MSQNRKSAGVGLLALVWFVIVSIGYYAGHKPITPTQALAIAGAIWNISIGLGILSLAGGLGMLLLPNLAAPPLAGMALRAGLGLGLLSMAVLLVGTIAGARPVLGWIFLMLPLGLLFRKVLHWWRPLADMRFALQEGGRLGKAIAVCMASILLSTLLIALAPAVKFDALVYHLALPFEYLSSGRIAYTPWNIFWGMPQIGEMLYLWALSLAGPAAAASLGWEVGLLALFGILGYARQKIGSPAAWVAIASLLAGYTAAAELGWAYIDWFTILFGLAFLFWLESWVRSGSGLDLLLAGIFAGFALGSKYSAGALLAAGLVIVAYHSLRHSGPRSSWLRTSLVNLSAFLLACLVAASPWLLKNALATGNPLYPFFFPSGAMSEYRLALYQGLPTWGGWRDVLLLPIQATLTGYEGAPGYSASIGPLMLVLVPVFIAGWLLRTDPKLSKLKTAAAIAGMGLVIWAVAGRLSGYLIQSRLYLGFFPALALLAGGGYRVISRTGLPGVRLGRIAGSLIVLSLGLNALQIGLDTLSKGALQAVAGIRSADEYLDANLGWYAPAARAIRDLPEEARVLMLWEPRNLYCLPHCYPDEVLDRWRRDLHDRGTVQGVLADWRAAGFSHVLINHLGADFVRQDDKRYAPGEWQSLDELLASLPPPVEFGEAYALYRLGP